MNHYFVYGFRIPPFDKQEFSTYESLGTKKHFIDDRIVLNLFNPVNPFTAIYASDGKK
jgi:hypothetical protein